MLESVLICDLNLRKHSPGEFQHELAVTAMLLMSTTALLYLAVLLPGPRAPLWRAVPVRPRPSVAVASADSALTAAAMPPLPTREEIELMDTLAELHARLALHGADFPSRRKLPLRNRLLELLEEEEEAAEERRFAEFGEEAGNEARYEAREEAGLQSQVSEEGEFMEYDAAAAPRQGGDVPRREQRNFFVPRLSSTQMPSPEAARQAHSPRPSPSPSPPP